MSERCIHGLSQHIDLVESCNTFYYVCAEACMPQYFIDQVLKEVEAITNKIGFDLLSGLQYGGLLRFLPEVRPFSFGFAGIGYVVGKFDTKHEIFCCHEGSITRVESY